MLERQTVIDQRTITEDGAVLVRYAMYIVDTDTKERIAGPIYHRASFMPGADVSKESNGVQELTALAWKDYLPPGPMPPIKVPAPLAPAPTKIAPARMKTQTRRRG